MQSGRDVGPTRPRKGRRNYVNQEVLGVKFLLKNEIEIIVNKSSLKVIAESENRKYKRSFSFSKVFDTEKTTASFNNGVLEISLIVIKAKDAKGHRVEID